MSNPNQKAKNSLNKGIVVGVPSGDTLVIVKLGDSSSKKGTDRPARLTEIELTLQGIKAPLLALYTQQTKKRDDKPFAWQSREYLRKKVIGQPVAYTVTKGFGNNTGRRQYGQAFVGDKFNVDLRDEVVANGWASVIESSQGTDQKGPRNDGGDNGRRIQGISHLLELQKKAKDEHRGIWNTKMENHSIRQIIHKYDAFDLFDRLKGRHIPALVEQVRSGTTLKLYLPETGHNLPLLLSGVQSPVYKYLNAEEEQEPYAREARFFTELRVLHRDVDVVLEGLDKAGNFFGTVLCNGANLSVQLLKEGLARFVEWSAAKTSNVNELKKAEDDAKAKHSGLWKQQRAEAKDNSNQKPKQKGKQSNDFIGKVIEIVNAGTISVVDEKNPGVELRVTFSSIQVPRLLSRERMRDPEVDEEDRHNAAYAWEGKEYLRKKLIGQKVKCVLDYVRPPFKDGNQTLPEKPFYGVYFDKKNVAVDLVEKGFATVLEHKGSENRSPDYEEMVLAENKSKKKGVGLHGPKSKKPIRHYTDLTLKELEEDPNAAKDASAAKLTEKQIQEKLDQAAVAKLQQHLPHLTRAGKIPATVEKVYTGCRFKLWVEKESCIIPFVLHSIRCEKMVQTGRNPPSFDPAKSVGNKAYQFAKDLLYQHDVEIIVDSVDKRGNFVGMLTVGGKKDFATLLLEDGLASVFHPSASRTKGLPYEEYKMAENNAKSVKKGVWENYDEAAEEARKQAAIAKRNEERGNAQKKGAEILNVELTEIINGSQFFYQIVGEEKQALEQMMKDFNAQNLDETKADPSFQPKAGDFISAKFTGDDTWYRASVNKALDDGTYDVYYIDYGNSELLEKDRIRPLQKDFGVNVLPAQAHEGKLAYIRTPSVDDDYGADAAAFLREMAWGKKMVANVQHHEGNVTHLVLGDPETQVHVNAALLKAGLAIVVRGRPNPLMSKLREQEQQAKKNRVNLWQYGDLPESDEE